eukprot:TRINITY_DN2067_c0_g1_i1.p1 TRINITY_DN2067_c0_g1~~TRINITY_DN2067_c0_g1_i1.p1  ORF type:complete len:195 (-),score=32.59 TRINITY_DN2067_c0_g1_i1:48-632(-)
MSTTTPHTTPHYITPHTPHHTTPHCTTTTTPHCTTRRVWVLEGVLEQLPLNSVTNADRHYTQLRQLTSMRECTANSFRVLVAYPVMEDVSAAFITLYNTHRTASSPTTDLALLTDTIQALVETSSDKPHWYTRNFEDAFLLDTTNFHTKLALTTDSQQRVAIVAKEQLLAESVFKASATTIQQILSSAHSTPPL